MKILGMKRFYGTLALVREVRGIRDHLLLRCAVSDTSSSKKKAVISRVKFDNLPKSGRDLIARTHLVEAIEQTEVQRLDKVPWEELISQAQHNVLAYREWVSMSETRE